MNHEVYKRRILVLENTLKYPVVVVVYDQDGYLRAKLYGKRFIVNFLMYPLVQRWYPLCDTTSVSFWNGNLSQDIIMDIA